MMIAAPIEEVVTSHILTAERVEQLWSDRFANCLRKGGAFNKHSFFLKKVSVQEACFASLLHVSGERWEPTVCI